MERVKKYLIHILLATLVLALAGCTNPATSTKVKNLGLKATVHQIKVDDWGESPDIFIALIHGESVILLPGEGVYWQDWPVNRQWKAVSSGNSLYWDIPDTPQDLTLDFLVYDHDTLSNDDLMEQGTLTYNANAGNTAAMYIGSSLSFQYTLELVEL